MRGIKQLLLRIWQKICAGWEFAFVNPSVRIVSVVALFLVLFFGALKDRFEGFGFGWLPGWYTDVYGILAAVMMVQPLLAGITDAVTKRRLQSVVRESLDEGLGKLVERVRDIARITTGSGWGHDEARGFERNAVEALQHLFTLTGLPDPRICFYEISTSDDTEADSSDNPVVQELTYVHHHPGQRPTTKFLRDEPVSNGMFEALDTRQPSRVDDRPNYDPQNHRWRSALRVPVHHDNYRWGVLTLDSSKRGATKVGYAEIMDFGAALIGLARLCEDIKSPPTDTQIAQVLDALGNKRGGKRRNS